jgi:DNA-binding PucR family transcriptional regulator
MERIAQIGGFDLENPETRLAVNLALKIRRLLNTPR